VAVVAKILDVSPDTVMRLYKSGVLPGIKRSPHGLRFHPTDVGVFAAKGVK
jgi:hypothetical protein